jgi:CHAT domain-containing protein
MLPSLAATSVSVAPSANGWARATRREVRERPRRAVLVAGPGLRHAVGEIESVAALYPEPTLLTGDGATGPRLAEAVRGADLLHIAAHGIFRRDNPLFSAIELADGPMTAYDLQRLPDVAPLVVLANCESGLTDVRPGDELLGISATLMSKGVRTLLATIVPIPDAATPGLMVDFHRHLAAGVPPSTALHRSVRTSGDQSFVDAAAAAFVCFGAG